MSVNVDGMVMVPRYPTKEQLEVYENTLTIEGRKGPGAAVKAWAALLRELGADYPEIVPSSGTGTLAPLADREKSAHRPDRDMKKLLRIAAAAKVYFDHYVQDEADDVENCFLGEEQHRHAVELKEALE